MNIKLSAEQRDALSVSADQPIPIEDEQSHKRYYLLKEETYLHLQGLDAAHDHECQARLRELIAEGMRSPGVPADEAFARLRAFADNLSRTGP